MSVEQPYFNQQKQTTLAKTVSMFSTGCVEPGLVTTCDGPNPVPLAMPIFTISAGGVAGVVLGMVIVTMLTAFVSFYVGKRHVGVIACCGWVLYDPSKDNGIQSAPVTSDGQKAFGMAASDNQ